MKEKVLILAFIFISTDYISGQEIINNFQIENKEIIWQKVFETDLKFEQLTEKIKDTGLLEKFEIGDNKLTGEIKKVGADFKGAGFSEMGTPMYIARSYFSAFLIIEFKDGKYRTTLKKIILTQKYDDGLSEQGEESTLTSYALKAARDEMKGAFKKSPSIILDYTFTDKFSLNDTSSTKDDW